MTPPLARSQLTFRPAHARQLRIASCAVRRRLANMTDPLLDVLSRRLGAIPVGWAGATATSPYVNFGDALSPVMVALCTGLPVARVPFGSTAPRLAAVGTIGHGFAGGTVWFWGTGSSLHRNPFAPGEEKQLYTTPADTTIRIAATRGPISEHVLGAAGAIAAPGIYGDPVWLLPRFHRRPVKQRWDLGVILHLSDLTDRAFEVHFNPLHERYVVPPEFAGRVKLINTVTPVSVQALFDKVDEIRSCRRIVSTSLHGLVIPESYGIPCLYFAVRGKTGLAEVPPELDTGIDPRILDLYGGLRLARFPIYVQPRRQRTDWDQVIRAVDAAWEPRAFDGDALLAALPVAAAPVAVPDTNSGLGTAAAARDDARPWHRGGDGQRPALSAAAKAAGSRA